MTKLYYSRQENLIGSMVEVYYPLYKKWLYSCNGL